MRVITAVYLHCRPELRDEWLCGGDVDGVVEEAVPLEQAGRSLVHWWHLRRYRDIMEGGGAAGGKGRGPKTSNGNGEDEDDDGAVAEDEGNFFERELERMGWGIGGAGAGDGDDGVEGPGIGQGGSEWEGGPLQLEGWA